MGTATKEMLLALFENARGRYVSGEEAAEKLNVSRTAVWKAVKALREEGFIIEAVRNRGYCLAEENDVLSKAGVLRYIDAEAALWIRPEVTAVAEGSTNDILKRRAASGGAHTLNTDREACGGEPEGCALIAGAQTAGKGRAGRSFFSPPGTGVYLSLLLRPEGALAGRAVAITTMAAVAACRAIEKVSGREALIKWVNDIYVDGKKVSGILTEASFDMETGLPDYAVLGIGFNVFEPEGGFPEEIRDRAGSIFRERAPDARNRLAAEFLNEFSRIYRADAARPADYTDEYRRRSFAPGRRIFVISGGRERAAHALDIDSECRLRVLYEDDGSEELLSSGEIRIRL